MLSEGIQSLRDDDDCPAAFSASARLCVPVGVSTSGPVVLGGRDPLPARPKLSRPDLSLFRGPRRGAPPEGSRPSPESFRRGPLGPLLLPRFPRGSSSERSFWRRFLDGALPQSRAGAGDPQSRAGGGFPQSRAGGGLPQSRAGGGARSFKTTGVVEMDRSAPA